MAIANPNDSVPYNPEISGQETTVQSLSLQSNVTSPAKLPYDNPLASVAVVHPRLCARAFTHVRLRENLLAHMCDEFEVCSVSDDRVWMRADGMRCVAGNNRTFWDEDYRPVASFSDIGTRVISAVKVEGPGYGFLVRECACVPQNASAQVLFLVLGNPRRMRGPVNQHVKWSRRIHEMLWRCSTCLSCRRRSNASVSTLVSPHSSDHSGRKGHC